MFGNQRTRHLIFSPAVLLILLASSSRLSLAQAQSPFLGSAPTDQATSTTLELSLHEAFERALKYNLGAIESGQNTRAAHALRLRNLNALLPDLTARVSGALEQINFGAQGLKISYSRRSHPYGRRPLRRCGRPRVPFPRDFQLV